MLNSTPGKWRGPGDFPRLKAGGDVPDELQFAIGRETMAGMRGNNFKGRLLSEAKFNIDDTFFTSPNPNELAI